MATKPLQSIKFPGLSDTYTTPQVDATLTTTGAAADAKKVGDEITSIKQDLSAIEAKRPITDYTFAQGTISLSTGENGTAQNRCRTGYISFSNQKMIVTPKEGYKLGGRIYSDKSGTYVDGSSFSTEEIFYADATKFYRFAVAKTDDSNITPSSLPEDVLSINEIGYTDKTLTLPDKCADAKVTGEEISENKSGLNDAHHSLNGNVSIPTDGHGLVQGTYNSTDGSISSSTTHIRTGGLMRLYKNQVLKFTAGTNVEKMTYAYRALGSTGSFTAASNYLSSGFVYTVPDDREYIFVFRKGDNTEISPSDYDATMTIESYSQTKINDLIDIKNKTLGFVEWEPLPTTQVESVGATNSNCIGVSINSNIITLNGTNTKTSTDTKIRILVSKKIQRCDSAAALINNVGELISLVKGHAYRIKFDYISGSVSAQTSVILRNSNNTDIAIINQSTPVADFKWTSDTGGYIFIYSETASMTFNNYAFKLTITDLTVSEDDYNLDLAKQLKRGKEFVIPRSMVWGREVPNANNFNTFVNNDNGSVTVGIRFRDAVLVKPTDNLEVSVYDLDDNTRIMWTAEEVLIPANSYVRIAYRYSDGSDFTAVGVEKVKLYTSLIGYEYFQKEYFNEVSFVTRAVSASEATIPYFNPCYGGTYWTSNSMDGCRTPHTDTNYRSTKAPIYSKSGMYVVIGYSDTLECTIFYDDYTYENLYPGAIRWIEPNTIFTISFNSLESAMFCAFIPAKEEIAGTRISQRIANYSFSRADASFRTDLNTIYFVDKNANTYSVVKNGSVIKNGIVLDHTVGHANTCNYIDGKVYISDWYPDSNLIHVFNVDTETNEMAYAYDITIPYENNYGNGFFVCDANEKQIISLGHKYPYDMETNETNNLLLCCIWNKIGNTYEKSREFSVPSPSVLQGIVYVEETDSLYYVACASETYRTVSINKIPMGSGITKNGPATTGGLSTNEGEGIMYLASETFIVTTADGDQFLYKFK